MREFYLGLLAAALSAGALPACQGEAKAPPVPVEDYSEGQFGPTRPVSTSHVETDRPSGIRRLSARELERSFEVLTKTRVASLGRLPPDSLSFSYDRVVDSQTMSQAHLDAFTDIASDVATTLLNEQRLAELEAACSPAILPPPGVSRVAKIVGAAMAVGPEWAVGPDNDNPNDLRTQYAPDPQASYSHAFDSPGSYRVRFNLTVSAASVDKLNVLFGGQTVHTRQNVAGPQVVELVLDVKQTGTQVIDFVLTTEPDDNALVVSYHGVDIEGPVDPGEGAFANERAACVEGLVGRFASKAYRRPLSADEQARLRAVHASAAEQGGYMVGIRALLEAILGSPHFLYLVEVGSPVDGLPGIFRLSPQEIAARLSYSVCEEPPDEPLAVAARTDGLNSIAQIEGQAARLLAKPCAQTSVQRFFEQWLHLNRLPGLNKDPKVFPEYTEATRQGMLAESTRFVNELFWNESSTLQNLLSANYSWPTPETAALYGMSVSAQEKVTLPSERLGILTQPAVLALTGIFDGTSPVHRGVYVLEQFLCDKPPPPPTGLNVIPPPPDPNATTRERWAQHSNSPTCAPCHNAIDPIGFALEGFDGIGRFRATENGLSVVTTGGIPSIGLADGSITGAAELTQALANSEQVRACFAKQWLRFSVGRLELPADAKSLDTVGAKLSNASIKDAFLSSFTTGAFLHRIEEPSK
ncbi:MAG: DUF1592 domain-containing protein [Polyangiaceae bacterium]|nr:DUF1592 domain-containing protein [Polyangiaceae bacterium]